MVILTNKINLKYDEIKETLDTLKKLDDLEIIKIYKEEQKKHSHLVVELNQLIEEYQKVCNHHFWYKVSERRNAYGCNAFYICKCLDCGKIEEKRDIEFIGHIVESFMSYEGIKDYYDNLKNVNFVVNEEMMIKLLNEK